MHVSPCKSIYIKCESKLYWFAKKYRIDLFNAAARGRLGANFLPVQRIWDGENALLSEPVT